MLASASLSKATLHRIGGLGVEVRTVEDIASPPEHSRPDACWSSSQYTKLHIWSLTEFTKLVYIDADCMVCEPIDEVSPVATIQKFQSFVALGVCTLRGSAVPH